MAKNPYTPEEKKIMNLLVEAHNEFVKLQHTHNSDPYEWADGIHKCQNVLINRIVRRDYPEAFTSIES